MPPASRVRPRDASGEVCRLNMATLKHIATPSSLASAPLEPWSGANARPPSFVGLCHHTAGYGESARGHSTHMHSFTSLMWRGICTLRATLQIIQRVQKHRATVGAMAMQWLSGLTRGRAQAIISGRATDQWAHFIESSQDGHDAIISGKWGDGAHHTDRAPASR